MLQDKIEVKKTQICLHGKIVFEVESFFRQFGNKIRNFHVNHDFYSAFAILVCSVKLFTIAF